MRPARHIHRASERITTGAMLFAVGVDFSDRPVALQAASDVVALWLVAILMLMGVVWLFRFRRTRNRCRSCRGKGVVPCVSCHGKGTKADDGGAVVLCPVCAGMGELPCPVCRNPGMPRAT